MTRHTLSRQPAGPSRARRLLGVGLSAGLVLGGIGASGAAVAATDPTPIVSSSDQAALSSLVVSAYGGRVTAASSRTGAGGSAMRFPAFEPAVTGARAVLEARSTGAVDVLNPGTADFSVGAEIMLDQESHQKGTDDNGNNVLQRGLFNSTTQYKIQIDNKTVTCRVKGRSGDVIVTSRPIIVSGEWFGLACSRVGDTVSLAVTRWDDGIAKTQVVSDTGVTGDLTPSVSSLPFAIGAKVHDLGGFTDSSDQFNGVIDNPYLRIGDRLVSVTMPAEPVGLIATTSHLTVSDLQAPRKSRVRFTGTVSPGGASAGSTVVLKLKKTSGVKKKLGERTLSTTGTFVFDNVKVKNGRYKLIFPRQSSLLRSKAVIVYKNNAFRPR